MTEYGPGETALREALRRRRAARSRASIPEGLPSRLYFSLRTYLLHCGPFHSADALQSLFVDERIHAWYNEIAFGQMMPSERVRIVIDKLYSRSSPAGDNALCQFLLVLVDMIDPGDVCKANLEALHADLSRHCRGGGKLNV